MIRSCNNYEYKTTKSICTCKGLKEIVEKVIQTYTGKLMVTQKNHLGYTVKL